MIFKEIWCRTSNSLISSLSFSFKVTLFLEHKHMFLFLGLLTLVLTNPIWVVKTRLCLQYEANATSVKSEKYYSGMADALFKIYKQEGFRGYYKVSPDHQWEYYQNDFGVVFPVASRSSFLATSWENSTRSSTTNFLIVWFSLQLIGCWCGLIIYAWTEQHTILYKATMHVYDT